jgi:hypothetical protein
LAFKPGEDVDDFALHLTTLRQQMEQYGDYDISEERAVAKFLRSSAPKFLQLNIAIQTILDISALTIEEVTGWFKAVDDEEALAAGEAVSVGGKLHYAIEHYHCDHLPEGAEEGESSSSSGSRKRGPRRAPKAREGAEGGLRGGVDGAARRGAGGGARGGGERAAAGEQRPARDDNCCNCGRAGHWARECRQSRCGQAHVA